MKKESADLIHRVGEEFCKNVAQNIGAETFVLSGVIEENGEVMISTHSTNFKDPEKFYYLVLKAINRLTEISLRAKEL